jgi:hypothetical protein
MLELTAATFRKMPARRCLVVRTEGESTIVEHCVARHAEGHMAPA